MCGNVFDLCVIFVMREMKTAAEWKLIGGVNMKRLWGNVFDLCVMFVMGEMKTAA